MMAIQTFSAQDDFFVRLAWLYIRPKEDSVQNEVLFVRAPSGGAFFIPGGRQVWGREDEEKEVLAQKIRLDLAVDLVMETLRLYVSIQAPAFGKEEGVMVKNRYYFAEYIGLLKCTPQIYQIEWITCNDNRDLPLTEVDQVLLMRLKDDGILK
jgi:hypothetical protein